MRRIRCGDAEPVLGAEVPIATRMLRGAEIGRGAPNTQSRRESQVRNRTLFRRRSLATLKQKGPARGEASLRLEARCQSYLAGGSWVCVEPGALSGLPPGIWAVPSDFGAAEFGAAPVVAGGAVITAPLGGAGRTTEGFPSIGVADCAYTRGVVARISTLVNSPNDIFCILCSS